MNPTCRSDIIDELEPMRAALRGAVFSAVVEWITATLKAEKVPRLAAQEITKLFHQLDAVFAPNPKPQRLTQPERNSFRTALQTALAVEFRDEMLTTNK